MEWALAGLCPELSEKKSRGDASCPSRARGRGCQADAILFGRGRSSSVAADRSGPLPIEVGRFPPRWAASLHGVPLPFTLGGLPWGWAACFRAGWLAFALGRFPRGRAACLRAEGLAFTMDRFPWGRAACLRAGRRAFALGRCRWGCAACLRDVRPAFALGRFLWGWAPSRGAPVTGAPVSSLIRSRHVSLAEGPARSLMDPGRYSAAEGLLEAPAGPICRAALCSPPWVKPHRART